MNIEQKDSNLKIMVGVMQGSIEAIQQTLSEIKKSIIDLRIDINSNYVTKDTFDRAIKGVIESRELELKNIRESFEPTKKTVESIVSQVLKYTVGFGLGLVAADKFIPKF